MPCGGARRRPSGTRSRWRCSARTARSPTRAPPPAPPPRTRRSAPPLRDRPATRASCRLLLLLDRGLAPGEFAELLVGCPVAPRAERLAVGARSHPAGDQPGDGVVELLGRHASEDRSSDRCRTVEAPAQVHVVGLVSATLLVAHGRALEADVADPVLRARMRATVEMQPQTVERALREPLLEELHETVHTRLRLGHREVAV